MIGQRIRLLREEMQLSRREFGEKIGVSGDVINNWERERVKIPDMSIKLICSVFSIREEWLRNGSGEIRSSNISEADAFFEQLINQYDLGTAGQLLLRATFRIFSELDEETARRLVEDVLSELQAAVAARSAVVTDPSSRTVPDPQASADSSAK